MKINCSQWSKGELGPNVGHCAAELYGGRPSYGTCRQCPQRDGGEPAVLEVDVPEVYRIPEGMTVEEARRLALLPPCCDSPKAEDEFSGG